MRLQVGLGHNCRGSLAKIRQVLDTKFRFRMARGWVGWGVGRL